jgi:hypothetical protein
VTALELNTWDGPSPMAFIRFSSEVDPIMASSALRFTGVVIDRSFDVDVAPGLIFAAKAINSLGVERANGALSITLAKDFEGATPRLIIGGARGAIDLKVAVST